MSPATLCIKFPPKRESARNRLLELDGAAGSFDLFLDGLSVVLGSGFFEGLRRIVDQVFGFLEAQTGHFKLRAADRFEPVAGRPVFPEFGQLHRFEDPDFFAENRTFTVYLPDRELSCRIFSARFVRPNCSSSASHHVM